MKFLICIPVILFGAACATVSQANITNSRTVLEAYVSSLNACDADRFANLFLEQHKGLKVRGKPGNGFDHQALTDQCAAGYRLNASIEDVMSVPLEDRITIVSATLTGSMLRPNGETSKNNLRLSLVLQTDGGAQKIIYSHMSP